MLFFWMFLLFIINLLLLLRQEEKVELRMKLKPLKEVKKIYQAFFFELLRTQYLGEEIFLKLQRLPSFFSYKTTIEKLLILTREIGASKKIWGSVLRHNFQTQINFQISVREKIKEIIFQLLLVYLMTYSFAYLLQIFLEDISLNLIPIFCWHILGSIIFVWGLKLIFLKNFKGTEALLNALLSFQCLLHLGLSQQRVIEISQITKQKGEGSFYLDG